MLTIIDFRLYIIMRKYLQLKWTPFSNTENLNMLSLYYIILGQNLYEYLGNSTNSGVNKLIL